MVKLFKRKQKEEERIFCTAVVPAAGSSTRMGGINKIFAELDGIPVLIRTLMALESCEDIREIIVVTRDTDIPMAASLCKEYGIEKVTKIVCGGAVRAESVYNGVREASPEARLIAVHDGARPFITPALVGGVIKAAAKYNAAAPGVRVKDTVKVVKNGRVIDTPNRDTLYAIQTPQIFDADLLKGALTNAVNKALPITDDCMAVEAVGAEVRIVQGSYDNIKITTPEDIYTGMAILAAGKEKV
ncbi:MAG: 2-C-methyl-D-erythritol 4-phosphate cytidylyltransferase [Ruminococcaceae bacterium]|nr:2-C-methyl-D-erythritol 4-phosphate cytidylyltransferase [Oscillospiraceae bacterium]